MTAVTTARPAVADRPQARRSRWERPALAALLTVTAALYLVLPDAIPSATRLVIAWDLATIGFLAMITLMMAHATQQKYEYRHQWRYGDMVIWDNRSVMHKANPDYDMNERRYLYRLMLKGEPPIPVADAA